MGRPNIKIWALSILLNAIWALESSAGWRLESVEPNIIRDGDWINLYVSTGALSRILISYNID